jgi:hypothetical protein
MSASTESVPPVLLHVRPWPDPVIDEMGHDPRSLYVERFWVGVIGPTCTLLLRQLASRFEAEPEGFSLDVASCARSLGLGGGLGKQAPFGRAVSRCCQFGLAQRFGTDGVVVRRKMPPLVRHQLLRLPLSVQEDHQRFLDRLCAQQTTGDDRARRARQLALTLRNLGEEPESIRHQLVRWSYPASVSAEAADWADLEARQHPAAAMDQREFDWAGGDAA